MLVLDTRLQACAEFVTGHGVVCDIGTDHAYLPAYLILSGKCRNAIAADVNDGPLRFAQQTLERWNVAEQIRLLKSDGLQSIPMEGVTDIVIAGMGGELIAAILGNAPALPQDINLILQPMTQAPMLRKWLYAHGFALQAETPVQQERFFYTVMQAVYTGKKSEISPLQQQLGAMNPQEPLACAYARKQAQRLEKAGEGLQKGNGRETNVLLELSREIYLWAKENAADDNGPTNL